jgi:hypothetical protein
LIRTNARSEEEMTAASTASKYLTDNRSVVAGKDDAGVRIAILPTLPDGLMFTAKDAAGADIAGETAATAGTPAYLSSATVDRVIVPIDYATTNGAGTGSKFVRKQFFKSNTGDSQSGKWCYTNVQGWPLKADGTKALGVADAANALTTPLTAVGEAVTSYSQAGPLPGTYPVSERQQGYSPHLGWTMKQVGFSGGVPV